MKPIMLIGIVLIVLGVVVLAYQGISYTNREKIIDIGPIQATHETKKTIPLSTHLGWRCACRWNCVGHHWSQE